MLEQNLRHTVEYLSQTIGPRAPGSAAELQAAEYLRDRFSTFGLLAEIESFPSASHCAVKSSLRLKGGETFPSIPTQFSPGGKAEGKIVYLGTCEKKLVSLGEAKGKIGLLAPSGKHTEKIRYLLELEQAGLAGLVVISPYLDNIMTKVIRYPEIRKLPMVAVSWRTAVALKKAEGETVRLEVETEGINKNESRNVVATLKGEGEYWLAVTSHFDSAAFAPGALDNASGVAVMLEVARNLAGKRLPATIVFVATGSEEHGLTDGSGAGAQAFFGSREKELEKCIAHVEIDDVGNVLGIPKVYTGGNKLLREAVLDIKTELDYVYRGQHLPTGCDHGAAEQRGVPYVWMIDAGDIGPAPYVPVYHSPLDTVDFIDYKLQAKFVGFLQTVIETLSARKPFYRFVREGNRLIRPARHADIPEILEITRLAFEPVSTDRMREDFFGEKLGGTPWHEYKNAGVEKGLRDHIYSAIVCEIGEKVVGYATYFLDETRGLAEIGNNAVHPDYQRRGIGKAMQREVLQRMEEEGYKKFIVTTLSVDLPAQKVYEGMGYEKYAEAWHYCRKA
jgi:aminopeptidase YwaD